MILQLFKDFAVFLPEFFLAFSICYLLIYGSFIISNLTINKTFSLRLSTFWLSFQVFFILIILLLNSLQIISKETFFYGILNSSSSLIILKSVLIFFFICVLFSSKSAFNEYFYNSFEIFILYLLSCFGILFIIISNDLLGIYLGLELQSLALYTFACLKRNSAFSTEAGLKYFIIGAFSSGLFLFASSILYGFFGTTNLVDLSLFTISIFNPFTFFESFLVNISLVVLLSSFLFKLSVAPWHFWSIDVYEGSPIIITLFFSVIPKMAFFIVLIKICSVFLSFELIWGPYLIFCGCLSIFFGAIGALIQKKVKRFFIYSTVSHIGFLICALGSGTILGIFTTLFYLFIYIAMSYICWNLLLSFHYINNNKVSFRYLDEFSFIFKDNFFAGLVFIILLFSIAGVPPLAGFYAKYFIFLSLVNINSFSVCFYVIFISCVGCFYYLRVIKIMLFTSIYQRNVIKNNYFIVSHFDYVKSLIISFFTFFLLFFFYSPNFFYIFIYKLMFFLFLFR